MGSSSQLQPEEQACLTDETSTAGPFLESQEVLMTGGFQQEDRATFLYTFVRKLLLFYGHYNYIDYFAQSPAGPSHWPTRLMRHLSSRPWWASLIVLSYVPIVAFMSVYIYIHYYYDLHWYKYNKLTMSSPSASDQFTLVTAASQPHWELTANSSLALERHLRQSRSLLKSLGAQFLDAHFTIGVIYLFYIINVLGVYFNGLYHFGFKRWLNFTLARLMLDCEREQREYSALIRTVVANHIASGENYYRILLVQAETIMSDPCKSDIFEDKCGWSRVTESIGGHAKLMQRLLDLTRSSHFQPLEWTADGGAFMRRLYRYYGQFIISIMCFYLVVFALAIYALTQNYGRIELGTPSQLLFALVSMCFFSCSTNSTAFFASVMLVDCTEQLKSMDLLLELTAGCLRDNAARLQLISGQLAARRETTRGNRRRRHCKPLNSATIESHCWEMNVHLMSCFLHFKLFGRQFDRRRHHIAVVLVTSTALIFTLPLLVWLHLPYTSGGHILSIATILVVFQLVLYNSVCLPPCYLHAKSLRYYKQLNSLMAHISESIQVTNDSNLNGRVGGFVVYDKHLVWLLRKELNHPQRLLEHFSIAALGLRFTYAYLIRVHFWYGFGMLNLFCRSASEIDALLANFIG